MTHLSPERNMVLKAVLMRSGLVSLTTARPVNTAQPKTTLNSARPMTNVFNKAHSTVRRTINNQNATKNSNFNKRVNTVSCKNVNTARPKVVVNAARPKAVLNAVKGNQGNPQQDFEEKGVIDSGISRHMIGNMSYLTNFEKIDGGYVAFRGTTACDDAGDDEKKVTKEPGKEGGDSSKDSERSDQEKEDNVNSTNNVNAVSSTVNTADIEVNDVGAKSSIKLPDDPNMPELEDIVYSDDDEDVGVEADMNNLDASMPVSPIPTTRIHKDHLVEQIIRDLNSAPQTRKMTKNLEEHGLFSSVQQRTNHKDFQNCLFACFLSQEEPKKVWTFVDLPNGKRAIGTKWVYRNKKDERGIVIKNKARLVVQGYTQEEGIDYDEVFAPIAKIEAIRLSLAFASFKDFMVYQMDAKSTFLYGKIEEEVYVCQPPRFEDPNFPDRVYKVEKALYGLHQAPVMRNYGKSQKALAQGEDGGRSGCFFIIGAYDGSLMYLTSSRPNIMFAVCACARYQVNLKVSHLHAMKRIFRYLKGQLKLGLWYLNDSPFDLVAYTDSDFARASLDRKSTIREVEYVAALSCYGQVLWIQNQLLDYSLDYENGEAIVKMKTVNGNVQLQALVDGKKIIIIEATVRRDLQLEYAKGIYCLPNADIFEQLTLVGFEKLSQNLTFYKAFFSPQWKFLIHTVLQCLSEGLAMPTDPHHIPIITQPSLSQPQRKQKSKRSKRKETEVSQPSDPTNVADEAVNEDPSMQLKELMDFCTRLQQRGRKIDDIDADAGITLDGTHFDADTDLFGVNDLDGDEVVVESEVTNKAGEKRNIVEEAVAFTDVVTIPVSAATITNVELTLAQTLAELKSARPKTKGAKGKDKGKAKMIEPEKPLKKKDQIKFDEEEALTLQAEFDEEDRLVREKSQQVKEANIAWDDIQAKIDVDYQLAERLQAQEQ
ncbi:ribonuclease H-like domain, reverse transcriptase, RNA-dependent DNA polymerase [Tanacetum coccineum]